MRSLKAHYLLVSGLTISIILVAATFVFMYMFGRNIERQIHADLTNYVNQIAAELSFEDNGVLRAPSNLSELRFNQAYSGLYWQINDPEMDAQLRSRSLWDFVIPLPVDTHHTGEIHRYELPGPEDTTLIVQERTLIVSTPTGARRITISTAKDREAITSARTEFMFDVIPFVAVLGALLFAISYFQFLIGLKPLDVVSLNLDAIRDRKTRRLIGPFPEELARLTDAMNNLLKAQDEALSKARNRSGDLAHGLKTPLTVIKNNADKLQRNGQLTIGNEIAGLVQQMEAHLQYELLRSRLVSTPEQRTSDADVVQTVDDIVKALQRVPSGEALSWSVDMEPSALLPIDPHDLRELIGNLIENSCKWADRTVLITGVRNKGEYRLTIEDDGPGLQPEKIQFMMERGKRFDESVGGTGIGLSIVREVCLIYNLPITIQNRQENGLFVSIVFPLEKS